MAMTLKKFFGVVFFIGVVCLATTASAQQGRWRAGLPLDAMPSQAAVDEGRLRFQKALKLYEEEGAVEAALAEIQRAYDVAPSWRLLFNIGQMARTHRDYALALHAYQRYLADGGNDVPKDRRAAVEKDIAELETYVGVLAIEVNLGGARVLVDGYEVGVTPLGEPIVVNAGSVRIEVAKDDMRESQRITVVGGETKTIMMELRATVKPTGPVEPQPPTVPEPTNVPPAPREMYTPHAWVGWTLTGLLAVGAVATGVSALVESRDLSETSFAGSEVPPELERQRSRVQALAIATDVLAGAAAVTLAVTAIVVLSGAAEVPVEGERGEVTWSIAPLSVAGLDGDSPFGAALRGDF
jgi:hypothetical protein